MCLKVKDLVPGTKYLLMSRNGTTTEATFLAETAQYGNTSPYSVAFVDRAGTCNQKPEDIDSGRVTVVKLPKIEKRYVNAYGVIQPMTIKYYATKDDARKYLNSGYKSHGFFEVTYVNGVPTDVQLIKE